MLTISLKKEKDNIQFQSAVVLEKTLGSSLAVPNLPSQGEVYVGKEIL